MNERRDQVDPRTLDPRIDSSWQSQSAPQPAGGDSRSHSRHSGVAGADVDYSQTAPSASTVADDPVIRPFLLTGGRTRPAQDGLRIEALVQAGPHALTAPLRFEARQIVELCQKPTSVAEVAAALCVPLGVARILVSDLVASDIVALVQREELSVQMIERIRDRVRAL